MEALHHVEAVTRARGQHQMVYRPPHRGLGLRAHQRVSDPVLVWNQGAGLKCFPADCSVCLPFTRLEHRSEELSLVIDICDPRTYPVLLTNQEPRWRYHLDFQCLVLRDAWLAQHLREKDHQDTAKFGDIIFNFRFVIKWLLNNLFIFLCSGQLTRSLCGLNYCSTKVDGRVAICPCL